MLYLAAKISELAAFFLAAYLVYVGLSYVIGIPADAISTALEMVR